MNDSDQPRPAQEQAQVAAGAGLVSIAKIIGGISNLLILVFLTRLLDQATFALVALVYLLQATINALGTLGLPAALLYYVPKLGPRIERSMGLWTGILLFLLAVPFALALWLGGPTIEGLLDKPGLAMPLFYLAIYLLADFPGQALPNYLLACRSYVGSFVVTMILYLSRMLSLVIPAWLGLPLEQIMFWFAAVAVLRVGLFLGYFLLLKSGDLAPQGWRIRDLFAYGVPLSLSQIVGKLNVQIDKYMIAALCAAEVFAVYSVGAIELPLVSSIAYSVTEALVPTLVLCYSRREVGGFIEYWHGAMAKVAAIMMPVFFFFFILAGPAMRVFFSDAYSEAQIPFRVYLCLLPLRLCGYGGVVRALGRTRPVLWAALAALVVNVALNYPLYLAFGMAGPATASVLAQVAAILVLLAAVRGRLEIPAWRVFPFVRVGRALVVAGLAATPLLFIDRLIQGDVAQLAVGAALFLPLYLVLGRLTRVLTADDFRYLGDLVTLRILKRASQKEATS